jgi:hypothetical protein
MPNIPGILGYIQPQVISRVRTLSKAVSIPGGLRVLGIVGEGLKEEVLVDSAAGDGTDGFDPTFTTQSDGYGRFFRLSSYPVVSNRSLLLLNGGELRIIEGTIDGSSFSSYYDAKLDPATGKIELQSASLVDLGGKYWQAGAANIGDGYLSTPTLVDTNAPTETWTIRCTSVIRDSFGAPRRYEASFVASGSVSGQLIDEYGQPYIWKSDGHAVSNSILSFAIYNLSPNTTFDVGDRFTIKVQSRVLQSRDNLEAKYIAELDLNTPTLFTDPNKLFAKHGPPSTTNTLSLGAQMAFENGASEVLALQAKPPLPRRLSEIVLPVYDSVTKSGGATGHDDPDDLIFFITAPGKPDPDSQVHFFIVNTDGTEEQIFPNKVGFYDADITAAYSQYETTGSATNLLAEFMDPSQSGMPFSYTVVTDDKIEQGGSDGVVTPIGIGSTATFYSPSGDFKNEDAYGSPVKQIDIYNTSTANEGRYEIIEVVSSTTVKIIRTAGSFVSETALDWQLINGGGESQRILLTQDLALANHKGLRVTYTDINDADFFDAGWAEALDKLETQDVQILVPLPTQTISAIFQAFRVHVEIMSSSYYKRERMLFIGAIEGLTVDEVTGVSLAAVEDIGILEGIQGDDPEEILSGNIEDLADYDVKKNYGDSFRVVYFYPDQIVRVVNGERVLLPGYYIAAAAGGWIAGNPNIVMPLTYKTLVGFTILNDKMFKETQLNKLGDSGITVVQPVTGGGKVLHGKTTTQSGYPEEEEISIVFVRDQIARTMRRSFTAFVGQPEDPTTAPSMTSRAISLLNAFVSQNWITTYKNLSIVRDEVEPRQWNIVVQVQPNYAVNWIFVDVSVGTL